MVLVGNPRKIVIPNVTLGDAVRVGQRTRIDRFSVSKWSIRDRAIASGTTYLFANRRLLTINYLKVTADLIDFTCYFSLTMNTAHMRSDGQDFVIYNSDDTVRLPVDIVNYNSSTGVLKFWVKVDAVSNSADTVLHMYYNCSTYTQPAEGSDYSNSDMWADHALVLHGNDGIDTSHVYDLSGNSNDGTKLDANTPLEDIYGDSGDTIPVKMHRCQRRTVASGTNEQINIAYSSSLDTQELTLEFCGFVASKGYGMTVIDRDYQSQDGYRVEAAGSGGAFSPITFRGYDAAGGLILFSADQGLTSAAFKHVVLVYGETDGSIKSCIVNGVERSITVTNAGTGGVKAITDGMSVLDDFSGIRTGAGAIEALHLYKGVKASYVAHANAAYSNIWLRDLSGVPANNFYNIGAETADGLTIGEGVGTHIEVRDVNDSDKRRIARFHDLY